MKRKPSKRAIRVAFRLYSGAPCAENLRVCPHCRLRYENFKTHAEHRRDDCPVFRRESDAQENNDMAKNANVGSSWGAPSADAPGELPDFLKPDAFGSGKKRGKPGATGTIVFSGQPPREIPSKFGKRFAFDVMVGKKHYHFGVNADSVNHRKLYERFGKKNPKGPVNVTIDQFGNKPYIAID